MSFRRLRYFLGEAFFGLVRNRLMAIASILTVASCMLIVSVFYILAVTVDSILQDVEDTVSSISVFIYNEVSAEDLNTLHEELLAIDYVTSVRFLSHPEAFEAATADFDDPAILAGIPPDTFPRSFEIEILDLRYHDAVAARLNSLVHLGIESILQEQNFVRMIIMVSNMIRWISIVLILILSIISFVIIGNTIRITVNARHTEINIMKYVGATDWFIRWPFIIEGVLIGVFGSLLPILLVWAGYPQLVRMVQDGLPLIEFIQFRTGNEIFVFLFPFVVLLGALIGIIGSGTSVRKHLHV